MKVGEKLISNFEKILRLPEESAKNYPAICETIEGVLRGRVNVECVAITDSSPDEVVLSFHLHAGPENIAELNMELADALAGVDPHAGKYFLAICCPAK